VPDHGPVGNKGALGAAEATGATPTDRGQAGTGTKRHVLTEGKGVPVAVLISEATRTARKKLAALLDAVVLERPCPQEDRAGTLEEHLTLDRGYDDAICRQHATDRGDIVPIPPQARAAPPLPAPGAPARYPARHWVVEVSHAWLNRFRRLLIRWEKQAANSLGVIQVAICLRIYRKLRHARSLSG